MDCQSGVRPSENNLGDNSGLCSRRTSLVCILGCTLEGFLSELPFWGEPLRDHSASPFWVSPPTGKGRGGGGKVVGRRDRRGDLTKNRKRNFQNPMAQSFTHCLAPSEHRRLWSFYDFACMSQKIVSRHPSPTTLLTKCTQIVRTTFTHQTLVRR